MRWFKHFSDNHRGRSMQFLFDQYGHKSLSYYILLEMCADKLEKTKELEVDENDCVFYFHERTLTTNLRLNRTTLHKLLRSCEEYSLFSCEFSKKEIKIKMPMLLNLLEKNFKKRPKKGLTEAFNSPLDIDKDLDLNRDSIPKSEVFDRIKLDYSPDKPKFIEVLKKYGQEKNFKLKVPELMFRFETPEELESFIDKLDSSKKVNEIGSENLQAAVNYIAVALKKEAGIIK